MFPALHSVDVSVFLFFNGLHSHYADIFFYWVSNRFVWIPLYLFLLFLIIKREKKRSIAVVVALILGVFLCDQTCNIIKQNVGRSRPSHSLELAECIHLVDYPDGEVYRGGQYGFPSSHAANSLFVALFAIFYAVPRNKKAAVALISWSLLLGYSRIYLGVHYPSDLLAGYVIGILFAVLLHVANLKFVKLVSPADR